MGGARSRQGQVPRESNALAARTRIEIRVFEVFNHGPVFVDARNSAEIGGLERPQDDFLPANGFVQVVQAIGDVRQVPEFPWADVSGVDRGRLRGRVYSMRRGCRRGFVTRTLLKATQLSLSWARW